MAELSYRQVISVLDHGFVGLVDSMGTDLRVINSAKVSFNRLSNPMDFQKFLDEADVHAKRFDGLQTSDEQAQWLKDAEYYRFYRENPTPNPLSLRDWNLMHYLAEHDHMSPFRHVQFTIHVKAPEVIMRQWYKHVVGIAYTEGGAYTNDHAWNEVSMRYISMADAQFYMPQDYRKQAENNKQASTDETVTHFEFPEQAKTWNAAPNLSGEHIESVVCEAINDLMILYNAMVESGVAKEQARMILPMNIYTEVYWTVSLQALINFIKLRDHEGAQWEIQEYARALRTLASLVAPVAVKALLEKGE